MDSQSTLSRTMSRANIPKPARRDFSIIIDEFQNYATPSIATFLSEARKYRTHLILANQFTAQIPPAIHEAILGNVGSHILFQLGSTDAELFGKAAFAPLTAENFMNIPKHHAYTKLLHDGMQSAPFAIRTIVLK